MRKSIRAAWALGFVLLSAQAYAQETADLSDGNPLFTELVGKGVAITPEVTVTLPAPVLTEQMSAEEQNKAMEKISRKSAAAFVGGSAYSPTTAIEAVNSADGKRVGTEVHFYFVAPGDLQTISDEGLLSTLVEVSDASRALPREARALTPEEHEKRGLAETARTGYEDWYYGLNMPVMNLVQLSGIGFAVRTRNDQSILAAINYMDKFADDPEFPSVWRKVNKPAGVPTIAEERHAYAGLGGYLKATQLAGRSDAVFIECHLVFAQPEGWFEGRDPLSSKLSFGIRDNAKKFALELKKAGLKKN